jgi:hypothetical protein
VSFFKRKDKLDFVQSVMTLEPKKGDIILIRTTHRLSESMASEIRESIHRAFGFDPEFKVIILEDGMDVGILRPPTDECKRYRAQAGQGERR